MKKSLTNASNIYVALIILGSVFVFNQPTKVESAKGDVYIPIGIEKQPEQIQVVESAPVVEVNPAPPVVQAPVTKTPTPKPASKQVAPKPAPAPILQPTPAPVPPPAPVIESCDSGGLSQQFLCLLNNYRKSKGLNAVSYEAALIQTAVNHSTWMSANNTMSHIGENGSTFDQRCRQAGTTCDGENVAMGYTTAQRLFDAWKASPSHNANLLGSHTRIGLALVGKYSTLVLR